MLLLLRRVAGATQAIVSEISSGVTSIRSSQRSRETNIVFCRRTLTTNDERARSATGYRGDDIGQGLSRPFHRRLVVSDTPQLLLVHHLKALKLPSFLREYDNLPQQCAAEGVDHPRYLQRLAELELIDRERRSRAASRRRGSRR